MGESEGDHLHHEGWPEVGLATWTAWMDASLQDDDDAALDVPKVPIDNLELVDAQPG